MYSFGSLFPTLELTKIEWTNKIVIIVVDRVKNTLTRTHTQKKKRNKSNGIHVIFKGKCYGTTTGIFRYFIWSSLVVSWFFFARIMYLPFKSIEQKRMGKPTTTTTAADNNQNQVYKEGKKIIFIRRRVCSIGCVVWHLWVMQFTRMK